MLQATLLQPPHHVATAAGSCAAVHAARKPLPARSIVSSCALQTAPTLLEVGGRPDEQCPDVARVFTDLPAADLNKPVIISISPEVQDPVGALASLLLFINEVYAA